MFVDYVLQVLVRVFVAPELTQMIVKALSNTLGATNVELPIRYVLNAINTADSKNYFCRVIHI